MKQNNLIQNSYFLARFSYVIIIIILSNPSQAQQYYDDYENSEEGNYNNDYYERYSEEEYKRRNEKFYKKSYKEQDLYNGRYKALRGADGYSNTEGGSAWSLFNFNKYDINKPTEEVPTPSPKRFNRYEGIENGVAEADNSNGNTFNSSPNFFEPGKGAEKPGHEIDSKVPPPPDEPDVPVSSPLLSLIMLGIMSGIACYFFPTVSNK